MDIKDYISSGVVEMYAMHALGPQEKSEFEQKLLLYPELKRELLKVQESLDDYASSFATNPRPELRFKLLQSIEPAKKSKKEQKNSAPVKENNFLTYKYLIAACLAALVVSTFASWFFYSRWNEAEDRYTSLLNDKNQLAMNYNLVKNEFDKNANDLFIIRDQDMKVIQLLSNDTSKHSEVRLYWNKNLHESYLDMISLPIPDEGFQYQLWSVVKGKPVDAGIIEFSVSGIQRMKDVTEADSWLVTLEPNGGSITPNLTGMYLTVKNEK